MLGEEKNLLPLQWFKPIASSLYRLNHKGCKIMSIKIVMITVTKL